MDGRHFTPTIAVKATFTQLPALGTMPPSPQAATRGASIFEQPPKKMAQIQPEI